MKRPLAITIICVIGYMSVVFTFPQVFSPPVKRLGLFMPAVYGILIAAQFIGCVGLWYYKRWGAELFVMAFFGRVLFQLLNDTAGPGLVMSAVLNLVFFGILLRHYPRMNTNL